MSAKRKKVDDDDVDITGAERKELRIMAANLRDDRMRGLLFKLLDSTGDDDDEDDSVED